MRHKEYLVVRKKEIWKRFRFAFLIACILTGITATGIFYKVDNTFSDMLYQREQALDGNIFVIGIDAKSLEKLGPYSTWSREYMAKAIEILNQVEEYRPAAIGIDILYTGETTKKEDIALAKSASKYNNVVMATAVNFASQLEKENEIVYVKNDGVQSYEEPYEALKKNSIQGHINFMYDKDGIIRHLIHSIDLPNGESVDSFDYELYRLYAKAHQLELNTVPYNEEDHTWYLSFRGNPGAYYDGFSFSDLIDGNLSPEVFAGSIVLIGAYAPGLMDYATTAIDHSQFMYGVEIHANAVDALIRNDFKQEIPNWIQLCLLFLICFSLVFFFYNQRVLMSTIIWIVVTIGAIVSSYVMYQIGYLLHLIWIPVSVTIIYISMIARNYVAETIEKNRVMNTFKHYVAPEIVNKILESEEDLELGGKMTDIAVLFVDIRGFTPMSEVVSPLEVVEILNRYLDLTSRCILRNKGTLDKFVGDATMAIFNAPIKQEDYIYQAVKTAWDMVKESHALNQELIEKYGRTVGFGIGIHCGQAVVGNIGAKIRMDYTAIGDTVNTAARLESNAPAGQILISRAVADQLEGRIKVTSLGNTIQLKGKAEGFEVLRLEGLMEE